MKWENGMLAAMTVLMLALVGCESSGEEVAVDVVVHASERDVDDYLPDADIERLAEASDRVVYGQVSEVERAIELVDDESLYSRITIEVDEGFVGADTETVDVWFLTHLIGPRETVGLEPVPEEGDAGIWFLTEIDPQFETDGYVRTNQQSWLEVRENGATAHALVDDTPLGTEVARLGTVEAVLERLRAVSDVE